MKITEAHPADAPVLADMAVRLWPENDLEEMRAEFEALTVDPDVRLFISHAEDEITGFAQCQLRHDYVEGTSTSPVGYLEAVFVHERWRRQGHARALVSACEQWSRIRGCREFASDCSLENTVSYNFHMALNFIEANRIICFTRRLD